MTKDEALDLALEALENSKEIFTAIQEMGIRAGRSAKEMRVGEVLIHDSAIAAIKQARSAPVQDSTCSEALRAQGKAYPRTCRKCGKGPCIALVNAALDKKAENARELGLDYEPVWDNLPPNKDVEEALRMKRLNQLAAQPADGYDKVLQAIKEARPAVVALKDKPVSWWLDRFEEFVKQLKEKNT
jgi:hypothetical protein